ncbi:hypothetical protein MUK42_26179 [Musa troglodytarum]|uniref:Uncharacterized protein n=1 Tax=Musa troglodytarum TaxID=320322 RepID=A0A9E7JB65_9LILI|nr:hypothetical protein MUK42_26179 [Musa troglodytarum]
MLASISSIASISRASAALAVCFEEAYRLRVWVREARKVGTPLEQKVALQAEASMVPEEVKMLMTLVGFRRGNPHHYAAVGKWRGLIMLMIKSIATAKQADGDEVPYSEEDKDFGELDAEKTIRSFTSSAQEIKELKHPNLCYCSVGQREANRKEFVLRARKAEEKNKFVASFQSFRPSNLATYAACRYISL